MIFHTVAKNAIWKSSFYNQLPPCSWKPWKKQSKTLKSPFVLPSPSSWIDLGWDTVKHCITSYRWQASWFSVPGSSGGWISILQLKVWLFRRVASWGQGTPFTVEEKLVIRLWIKQKVQTLKIQDIPLAICLHIRIKRQTDLFRSNITLRQQCTYLP